MKQLAQGTVEFQAEESTLRILAALAPNEQDSFINQAIQKFRPAVAMNAGASESPSAKVRHELERLFGASLGGLDAQESSEKERVVFMRSDTGEEAQCPIGDTLSILKSLRQPITPSEVWEIVASMAE